MKDGISGVLRVRNDGEFIERCVESCIDALDELVIVHNDCTDNSVSEIERMRKRYPEKIKVYEYDYRVIAHGLSEEEFMRANMLPDDSPSLLCNYYNFALGKVSFKYAMKIDADQIYFTDQLKSWCDLTREVNEKKVRWKYIKGKFLFDLFRLSRKISIFFGKRIFEIPHFIAEYLFDSYCHFAKVEFQAGRAALSLSGINVYHSGERCEISLGKINDIFNIMPPFNGENDHLIFKVSSHTYYRKFAMAYYGLLRNTGRSLIEEMVHPYVPINVGFLWMHVNAERSVYSQKIRNARDKYGESFVGVSEFMNLSFKEIERRSDKRMFTLYQRVLFSFLFPLCRGRLSSALQVYDR